MCREYKGVRIRRSMDGSVGLDEETERKVRIGLGKRGSVRL